MKIRRIIAAVMALVLVGGAYPSNAVNTRNIGKVYAAEAAEEKEPKFLIEKDEYKRLEPFSIKVKNVDPATISFVEENIEEVSKSSDEDGNLIFTFKARQSGEAHLIINYGFDGETREQRYNFNILEETYEDENSPKFLIEKDEYKRLEPFSIKVKNVDPTTISFVEENIEEVSKSSDEDGNLIFTFKARQSGEAHLIINYGFDGEIREQRYNFNILEETYEDENSPKFLIEKDEFKRLEPFSIKVKNVDPATISFVEENIEEVSKSSDEDGNLVFTFKARKSGEAHLIINYGFDGETREQRYNFNILEETYEDENSPKFLIEKDEYKRLEPFSIKVKNVDPATISFVEENIEEVSKSSDEDGNLVFTFKARQSGEAHLIINYGFDGEIREQRYNFNILEETYEDENSPKFLIEKDEYKRLEPFSIKVKNVDPATISFVEENIEEVSKSSDEDGNLVFTFKARQSGEAHLIINYGFDGEIREQRYNFNILEETYEDENSPKFLIEKDEYKRLEPFSIKVKNVDPATISFVEENIEEVSKSSDEDGNLVFTFKARQSGEAHLIINYGFDGETREQRYNFNILEETYEDENSPKFLIEKDEYKRLEPFSIKVKNVDPATISFVEENIEEVSKSSDEDGNLVFTFKARQSGEAHLIINYGFDGETREQRYNFNILEETYEDENSPKFLIEKDEYKRLEPFSIKVKNVDPATISFAEENIEEVSKSSDEDGNLIFTFKARQSGEAHLIINYGFDGETREQRYNFNILEEEYTEENTQDTNVKGDANCDGSVDMSDVVLIMQALANPNKYGVNGTEKFHITQQGMKNSDVDTTVKGVTVSDALKIQRYLLGAVEL